MNHWSADAYAAAWSFAAKAHQGDFVTDTELPYIVHVGNVAMEVMTAVAIRGGIEQPNLAVQCALLHDVVEDTTVELDLLRSRFGDLVADGVAALTKDSRLGGKAEMMRDSLERIGEQPHAVWMVKLADRITNLQPPPGSWGQDKVTRYREEAWTIHTALASACPVLGPRLAEKIAAYPPPHDRPGA